MLINPNRIREAQSNLVSQVAPEKAVRPRGYWAALALDVCSVLSALLLGWSYRGYLGDLLPAWVLVVALFCFAVPTLLSVLLVKRSARRLLVVVLEVAAMLSWFVSARTIADPLLLSAAILAVVFLLAGDRRSVQEYDNGLKFRFSRVMRPVLRGMLTTLVIVGILVCAPREDAVERFVPEGAFARVFEQGSALAKKLYPGIETAGTVRSFAESVAREKAESDPVVAKLSPALRAQVVGQAVNELVKGIEKDLGVPVRPDENLSSALYRSVVAAAGEWYDASRDAFFAAWFLFLFLLFRGIAFVLYYPLLLVAWFIFEVLIAANIVFVGGESRLHETVEYS